MTHLVFLHPVHPPSPTWQVQPAFQVPPGTPAGTDGSPAELGPLDAVQEQSSGVESHLGAQDTHGVPG